MYFTSLKHAVHKDTPVLPSLEKKKIDTFKKKTTLLNSCFTTSDYLLLYQLKHQFATGSFRYSKIALYNSITTDYCNIERSSPLEKDGSSSAQVPITIWRNFWSKLSLTCAFVSCPNLISMTLDQVFRDGPGCRWQEFRRPRSNTCPIIFIYIYTRWLHNIMDITLSWPIPRIRICPTAVRHDSKK